MSFVASIRPHSLLISLVVTVVFSGYTLFFGAAISGMFKQPERALSSYFHEAISNTFTQPTLPRELMRWHYEKLELLSPAGRWAHPKLQDIGELLLPKEVTQSQVHKFVDDVVSAAEQNPYLHKALVELHDEKFSESIANLKIKLDEFVPDLVAYAMVLDNMTKAMSSDPDVLSTVYSEFEKQADIKSEMSFAHSVKYYSVRAAIKGAIRAQAAKEVSGGFSSYLLPLNIAEAALLDWFYGNKDNAYAGWTLLTHGPRCVSNTVTGAAPASFGADGNSIALHMPYCEDWDNLYAAWNIGFVANLAGMPYHVAKLVIPSVNSYHAEPSLYMYNRVCALYVHAHYLAARTKDDSSFAAKDWSTPMIAKAIGKANKNSAAEYESKIFECCLL